MQYVIRSSHERASVNSSYKFFADRHSGRSGMGSRILLVVIDNHLAAHDISNLCCGRLSSFFLITLTMHSFDNALLFNSQVADNINAQSCCSFHTLRFLKHFYATQCTQRNYCIIATVYSCLDPQVTTIDEVRL